MKLDGQRKVLICRRRGVVDRCVALVRLAAANGWCIFSLAGRARSGKNRRRDPHQDKILLVFPPAAVAVVGWLSPQRQ